MAKFIRIVNGIPRHQELASTPYAESIYYSAGVSALTTITLPNSGYFSSPTAKDIEIVINQKVMESGRDFTVVGSGPSYTQIQTIYALPQDTVVRFIKYF